MRLAAVVVTYRRLDQLKLTVAALLAEAVDHIVVVDNASGDETGAWLAQQDDPRLHVLTLDDNMGGAGGFEAGMASARALYDPDWIVLMDDDARPAPGALARFRAEIPLLDTDIGCVAGAVTYPDGGLCEMNRVSRNPWGDLRLFWRTLVHGRQAGFHLPDAAFAADAGATPIDVASFVAFFVRRDAVDKVGLPEGGLFIYGDDVLYSLRLRAGGVGMVLLPGVRFVHDCARPGPDFTYHPLWKIYYHARNGVAIARQSAGPLLYPAALAYYTVMWWRRGALVPATDRPLYRKLMWAGLRDGLRGKRGRNTALH